MRQGEMMNLCWDDVDFKREKITLHETKNGDMRVIPLVGHAHALLKEHYETRSQESNLVFPGSKSNKPIGTKIEAWLRSLDPPKGEVVEYETYMLRLIDLGLLRLVNESAEPLILNELTTNKHQAIIEDIRCSSKLTIAEKEKMVEIHVLFSQQFSRDTCRLIMQGENQDFQRTIKKVISYGEKNES